MQQVCHASTILDSEDYEYVRSEESTKNKVQCMECYKTIQLKLRPGYLQHFSAHKRPLFLV